jgi:biopolymer transport protein ExbB
MLNWINSGGPLMWLILTGGALAMTIFFERLFHLHRAQINIDDFFHGIVTNLRHGNDLEAIAICDQTPGPAAHLVRAAILNRHEEKALLIRTVQQAGIQEVPRLERHTNLLITLAQVLPMIGLLGTVLGLLSMLVMLQQSSPMAEIGDLAGGLWTALLTTAAGLMTGIPAYAGYHFLIDRVESIALDMEQISSEIIVFLTQLNSGESNDPQ